MAKECVYKVNGEEFVSHKQVLTANEILALTRDKGVTPGQPDSYILKGRKRDYTGDDRVDLTKDDLFLSVHNTPTPVA